jgi:hypothetical protein
MQSEKLTVIVCRDESDLIVHICVMTKVHLLKQLPDTLNFNSLELAVTIANYSQEETS